MPNSIIRGISSAFPRGSLSSDEAARSTGLSADMRRSKLGIDEVKVASSEEPPSVLATRAVESLVAKLALDRASIEFLILVTQNPDFKLPTTACLVQHAANLPTSILAFDMNLGCSGFVAALSQADAMIRSGQSRRGLIVTAETYNRVISSEDKDTYGLFGDAAAAVLVEATDEDAGCQKFRFGTDGSGSSKLIVRAGGSRFEQAATPRDRFLYMDGRGIFEFVSKVVVNDLKAFLSENELETADVDHWVFHQANKYMNDRLVTLLGIDPSKAFFDISDIGNTVSATIPIALQRGLQAGAIPFGKIVFCGFGVGLSWASCLYLNRTRIVA